MSGYFEMRKKYFSKSSFPPWLATDTSLWLKGDNPLNTNIRWNDASPNDHVLNGTATLTDNVLNGQKGYVFNGTSDYFDGGDILDIGANSRTMIVIGKMVGLNGTFFAKSLYGGANYRYYNIRESNSLIFYVEGIHHSVVDTSTAFRKIEMKIDRSVNLNLKSYINDSLINDSSYNQLSSFNSTFNFLIGAYNNNTGTIPPFTNLYLNGTICEMIFLNRLLTTAENTELNTYLLTKYGL